jgi:hypothetical protein
LDTDATQGHINSVNLLLETNASFARIKKIMAKQFGIQLQEWAMWK